jgi:hypothetical protein
MQPRPASLERDRLLRDSIQIQDLSSRVEGQGCDDEGFVMRAQGLGSMGYG